MCQFCRIVLAMLATSSGIGITAHTTSNMIAAATTTPTTATTIDAIIGATADQRSCDNNSSSSSSSSRNSAACYYWKLSLISKHYSVHALPVPDAAVPIVCAGLEPRRTERGDCEIFGVKPVCQRHPKGGLDWQIEPTAGCSPADVGEIWHDVTQGRHGAVQCVEGSYVASDKAKGW